MTDTPSTRVLRLLTLFTCLATGSSQTQFSSPPHSYGFGSIDVSVPHRMPDHLVVYNLMGQMVRVIADRDFGAGPHQVSWDGLDSGGQQVASGIYLLRLRARAAPVPGLGAVLP